MDRALHGRGALLDADPAGLVPRLVGLWPHELRAVDPRELAPADRLPVLVLTGRRGTGKTAVLRAVHEAYEGVRRGDQQQRHTPLAYLDCEHPALLRPRAEQPEESWSPVSQGLLELAEQLGERVRHAGGVVFPRLMAGLVAVAASGWRDADAERIRRELGRILLLNEGRPGVTLLAGRWAGKVMSKVVAAASGQAPFVAAAIEATLESVTEGFAGHRQQKSSNWYRSYPNAGGNAQRGLILLSDQFRAGGPSREHAERWLVRALLADLAEAYTGLGSRLRRLGRPLVLLDNAHTGPGPALLGAVLRERADGDAGEAVFVAAVRGDGHPVLRGAPRLTLADVARRADWRPGRTPASCALVVPLTPLSAQDTLLLVGGMSTLTGEQVRFPHAAHRLTGGNPLGVTRLAWAVRRHPEAAVSLGGLLTAPAVDADGREEDGPLYGALLADLVPADRLEELTVLAAAHDLESAAALASAQLPDDFGAAGVRTLQARLAAEGLPSAPGHFVGDPFVRTLLLLRLHHGQDGHGKWREVHETLIAHYTADDAPDDGDPERARRRLHHELALGDTAGAVAHLRDTFPVLDTRTWLDTLCFLASAPYFPAHDEEGHDSAGPGDRRAAVALDRAGARQPAPDEVDAVLHQRVRRLLHAVWQLSDPLVLPDPRVCDRLRFELLQLCDLHEEGGALLWQAAQDWPREALAGRPLRTPADSDDDAGDHGDGGM
ncbi:hypothetical protein MTQ10_14115 [Streptomyces sp. XM83C]|uniref:hypothetical protein n=1 Tax=Streptomyces sp. XM83C TaxID=2929781 RepID=UPI001FF783F3|nr:hypothetical protein [Streptomyces sp. XM83C]MCK1820715.1 hypothetical protein [Streptomyces sp. XM83C]